MRDGSVESTSLLRSSCTSQVMLHSLCLFADVRAIACTYLLFTESDVACFQPKDHALISADKVADVVSRVRF